MSKIKVCNHSYKFGSGFHITFDNDVTVSVQFGRGTYSDNHDIPQNDYMIDKMNPSYGKSVESSTVEVMIWDKDHNHLTDKYPNQLQPDDVMGYVDMEELINILKWARDYNGSRCRRRNRSRV